MYSKKKRTEMTKGGMKPRTKKNYGGGAMSRKKANTGRLMYGAGGESVMPTAKPN
jgi:hypothetical protein